MASKLSGLMRLNAISVIQRNKTPPSPEGAERVNLLRLSPRKRSKKPAKEFEQKTDKRSQISFSVDWIGRLPIWVNLESRVLRVINTS